MVSASSLVSSVSRATTHSATLHGPTGPEPAKDHSDTMSNPSVVTNRKAVERLSAPESALLGFRAHLLFGEWLRRAGRRNESRDHLRTAHEGFTAMGAAAFAARAGRELAAAGGPSPSAAGTYDLTAQEAAVARLAATGHTNPEIGTALFLSPRTVEWHLRKAYTKLGITSRRQLSRFLVVPAV